MRRIEINLILATCEDKAHAERVLTRLRVELLPMLPEGYTVDAGLYCAGSGRRVDPIWLPDTDVDDPEFDVVSDLAYETVDRIRTEEEPESKKIIIHLAKNGPDHLFIENLIKELNL